MKKVSQSIRNVEGAVRSNVHVIDPFKIKVVWENNVRELESDDNGNGYGTEEEMQTLMNQIAEHGLFIPLYIKIQKDGEIVLTHGYRRMKAIHRLRDERNVIIKGVMVQSVGENEEHELMSHIIMNTSKDMSDFELGRTLHRLSDTFGKNAKEIAQSTGYDYQKVTRLISFFKNSGTDLQEKVRSGEMAINTAVAITKIAKTEEEQKEFLENQNSIEELKGADKEAQEGGTRKIKFNEVYQPKNKELTTKEIISKLREVKEVENIDMMLVSKIELVLSFIQEGKEITDLLKQSANV